MGAPRLSLADEPSLRPVPMMLGAYPAGPGWPGRNHGAPAACAAGRGCIAHAAPKGATGAPAPAAAAACGVDASDANGVASCHLGNWYDIRPAAPGVPIDGRADRRRRPPPPRRRRRGRGRAEVGEGLVVALQVGGGVLLIGLELFGAGGRQFVAATATLAFAAAF